MYTTKKRTLVIDLSQHNRIPLDTTPPESIKGLIARSSINRTRDTYWDIHFDFAKKVGWLIGAYCFFKVWRPARPQAEAFLQSISGKEEALDFPPVFDLEQTRKEEQHVVYERSIEWLEIVEAALGRRCMIYSSEHYMKPLLQRPEWHAGFELRPFWKSRYWPEHPEPGEWTSRVPPWDGYALWQCTSSNNRPDTRAWYNKRLDLNYFPGEFEDLKRFCEANKAGCGFESIPEPPSTPSPIADVDAEKAWEYNRRQDMTTAQRLRAFEIMSVDPFASDEREARAIASWQLANGLTPDAMIGPKTREVLGL